MKLWITLAGIIATFPALSQTAIDGDTIRIGEERVRILNIDTPEMRGKCGAEKMLARLAQRRLQAILDGSATTLAREGKDRYGRTLARLYAGGKDVGEILVEEGYARPWTGRRESWCSSP